ncbi:MULTISPECIES: hypothetical protein [unclassified Mesorhizobium]|nr:MULTISPECIES: hypothetical protein [unclassified Mesorhizobium]MCT2580739.1 hypothetical protein [Mesorhizobium sp. P13.3]MDF3169681.1 hypothetical protein [Mesorhizobium sp. P16.1]MDF3179467.1 hypothetical protein [Mesorhizobium sp. P17.1]MDF3186596.1 hypothetical protein [Mesorhizobium sp. ICCV3110.1]MDG4907026.1 hypothetical protein [Mesorhizobium sp. WSM4898]
MKTMADKKILNGGSGFEIAMMAVIVAAAMGLIIVAATGMQ